MVDRYPDFAALAAGEHEGHDYRLVVEDRHTDVAVIAPHGGWIEPATSDLARATAGDDYSLYCFEGLRPRRPHGDLHITSERFDEPLGRKLVRSSAIVVAIHGRAGTADEVTWLGGLDDPLVALLREALNGVGFASLVATGNLAGRAPGNICNDGMRRMGAQLELPRGLRDSLRADPERLARYAAAVRAAIAEHLQVIR
jgi:phage replication-related protein YjqB (UPF0714/DUF867 family)